MIDSLKMTVFNTWHRAHGGQMVEFGGWDMPLAYPGGSSRST